MARASAAVKLPVVPADPYAKMAAVPGTAPTKPHGMSLAMKPIRTAHRTAAGRDVYGRATKLPTALKATQFKVGQTKAASVVAAVPKAAKSTAPKFTPPAVTGPPPLPGIMGQIPLRNPNTPM